MSTHAVPDECRSIHRIVIEKTFEISKVILKPIRRVISSAAAEASPIWRDEVIVTRHRIDQELKRVGAVLESVEEKNHWRALFSPVHHTMTQISDSDDLVACGHDWLIALHGTLNDRGIVDMQGLRSHRPTGSATLQDATKNLLEWTPEPEYPPSRDPHPNRDYGNGTT
jgi:hypothetical protein